jgi:Fe(3+) dicitrate transport protein
MKLKLSGIVALALASSASSLYAADKPADKTKSADKTEIKLNQVVVNSILPDRLEAVPGSFNVVDQKQLEERRPVSIKVALST